MDVVDSRKEVNLMFISADYNPNNLTYAGANHYEPITRNESTPGALTLQELDGEEQPEMIDLTQASNCSSSPEKEMLDQVISSIPVLPMKCTSVLKLKRNSSDLELFFLSTCLKKLFHLKSTSYLGQ